MYMYIKSILNIKLFGLSHSFIIVIVFSIPTGTTFKLSSFGISWSAICIKYNFYLTLSGNSYNTSIGVCIGGTPDSWKIKSY